VPNIALDGQKVYIMHAKKPTYIDASDDNNITGPEIAAAVKKIHPKADVIITLNRSAIAIVNNHDGSCDMISYGDPSSQGMEINVKTVKQFATQCPSTTPNKIHIIGAREGPQMWAEDDEKLMVPEHD
jgi:hypothetical protein